MKLRAPIIWGIVVGVLQAASPLAFWWLPTATVYALGIAVIASVYIGFAVADGRRKVFAVETGVASLFIVVAAAAITGSPWLLVAGLVAHGLKDLWQHRRQFVANTRWWPPFCLVVDAVAATIIAVEIVAGVQLSLAAREGRMSQRFNRSVRGCRRRRRPGRSRHRLLPGPPGPTVRDRRRCGFRRQQPGATAGIRSSSSRRAATTACPGWAFPGDPDGYPTRDEVIAYLESYAERLALPVELGSAVRSLTKNSAHSVSGSTTGQSRPTRSSSPQGHFRRRGCPSSRARSHPRSSKPTAPTTGHQAISLRARCSSSAAETRATRSLRSWRAHTRSISRSARRPRCHRESSAATSSGGSSQHGCSKRRSTRGLGEAEPA